VSRLALYLLGAPRVELDSEPIHLSRSKALALLAYLALLFIDRGELERAAELYALASRYPSVANAQWFEDVAGQHIAAAAETLPPEIVTAAQERGRARDLQATVQELRRELSGEKE
jgi:hypothetical protein